MSEKTENQKTTLAAAVVEPWVLEEKGGKFVKRFASISEQLSRIESMLLTNGGKQALHIRFESFTLD